MVAKRRDDLVVEDVHDEVLVLDPTEGRATALNASAALVFEMCDGEHTIDGMKQALDAAGLGPSTDDTVWLALTELTDAGLIELLVPRARHLGRRELLKLSGAGAASIAALPVVETIGTPSPDSAGSPGGVAPATPAPTPAPATPAPTPAPTDAPSTVAPTAAPTEAPSTMAPSTMAPTAAPTGAPTSAPTSAPTNAPTLAPGTTAAPTPGPTPAPVPSQT